MIKRRLIIIALIVFSAVFANASAVRAGGDKIRVLVLDRPYVLNIKEDGSVFAVRKEGLWTFVNGKRVRLPIRFRSRADILYLNGRPYRGVLEVTEGKEGLMVVNELPLESYIAGIINNEISSKWPAEVIKAQAVVARTYAVFQMKNRTEGPYDIESTVMGQVYSGTSAEDDAASKAVKDTYGEILSFGGDPALTVYHSNAGGMTDSSKDIWAHYYPYLLSVASPYDKDGPRFAWEFAVPAGSLKVTLNRAGYGIGEPLSIELLEVTGAGRVKSLVIRDSFKRDITLRGEDLRKAVGYSDLRSSLFTVEKRGELFVFRGKGSGHGVGLSQWGAKGMAENGYSYREILRHYYPGTELTKAY